MCDGDFESNEQLSADLTPVLDLPSIDLGPAVTWVVARPLTTTHRFAVRGLQVATAVWSALGIAQLSSNTRADPALVVVVGLLAALGAAGLATLKATAKHPTKHPTRHPAPQAMTQVDPPHEQRGESLVTRSGRVEKERGRRLDLDCYPARIPSETQCPRCGHVFDSADSPDAANPVIDALLCPGCSNVWTPVGPDGEAPDVVIRSWLHT